MPTMYRAIPKSWLSLLLLGVGCTLLTATGLAQFGQAAGRTGSAAGASTEPRQYRSHTVMGDALIEIDQETRSLIIVADEDTNFEIGKVIQSLDRPKPQVLLEVLFLEVQHRDELDVGVEGSYRFVDNGTSGSLGSDFNLNSITEGGFFQVVSDDWTVTLRALAEKGKLKVLSRPSILARNNQEAVMMVGQEIPFVTNSQTTDLGGVNNTIQYRDIGIILRVTPFITSEGYVELIVNPEISNLSDETFPVSETVNSPIINKRMAETVVVTPNGKTVVIGGLIDSSKTEAVKKVPLLGDIPGLGLAFRRTTRKDIKTELLIFLTPLIIDSGEELLAATSKRVQDSELVPQAVPEEDLKKFLESLKTPGFDDGDETAPTGSQTAPAPTSNPRPGNSRRGQR